MRLADLRARRAGRWRRHGKPMFDLPLLTSLWPTYANGDATPTFTRATTATLEDFEGVLRYALSGEARFHGARRVRNLLADSEDLSGWATVNASTETGQSDPAGGTGATRVTASSTNGRFEISVGSAFVIGRSGVNSIWLRRVTGTGTITLRTIDGTYGTNVTLTSSWQRFSVAATTAAETTGYIGVRVGTSGDEIDVFRPMMEDVTGQTNQNPSEYVSVGVLSAPYHGAGVDGVKFFAYENGNTVSSNVVTEAQGDSISDSILKGYLAEGARTNLCLRSQEFDNASWTKFRATISANSVAAPDGTTTADSVVEDSTATSSHGVSQAITVTVATYTWTVYAKANTRSWINVNPSDSTDHRTWFDVENGTVGTNASGNTSTIEDVGNGWYRCCVSRAADQTSAVLQISLSDADNSTTYSGDGASGLYLWGVQVELGAFASSYIPTTSASVTRNLDALTYVTAGNFLDAQGTAYAEFSTAVSATGSDRYLVGDQGGNKQVINPLTSTSMRVYDGTNINDFTTPALSTTAVNKLAVSWGGGVCNAFSNGTKGTTANKTYDGAFGLSSLGIGGGAHGTIRKVRIHNRPLSDVALQALTA